jgi:hypothetical protein
MKKFVWSLMGVGAFLVAAQVAQSALTDNQKFTVTVAKNVSITAPVADQSVAMDPNSNSNVSFPAQVWNVKGNTLNGVSVTFSTDQAFTNTTDNTYKRDAQLSLATASSVGPAAWTIGTGTDATNYAGGDGVATVTASSNKPGQANFNLTVDFLTVDASEVAEGSYETTVTGTVTEN